MGTYKRIKVDADTKDPEIVEKIKNEMRIFQAETCWRKFCESTKWWPDDMMQALTTKFPNIVFRLDYGGSEVGEGPHAFYYDGIGVSAPYILPKFPPITKLKNVAAEIKKQKRQDKQRTAEQQRLKKIAKLEQELKELKNVG